MSVKTRIFLWIGSLFLLTLGIFFVISHHEVIINIQNAKLKIKDEITAINKQRQDQIEQYLTIALGEAQAEVITVLEKVSNHDWLLRKFSPSVANFDTNTWLNSSILMTAADSIDFIQCLNEEKVTSLIVSTPPYISRMAKIPIAEELQIIITEFKNGKSEISIGVPYWVAGRSIELEKDASLSIFKYPLPADNNFWLMFSIDAILHGDYESLLTKPITLSPKDAGVRLLISDPDFFKKIITSVINAVIKTQKNLRDHPELIAKLQSPYLGEWIKEEMRKIVKVDEVVAPSRIDNIESQFIQEFGRYIQGKHLIWALATLVGSGVWEYNPFNPISPKGIARFGDIEEKGAEIGTGLFAKNVFFNKPYHITDSCSPPSNKELSTCIDNRLSIIELNTLGSGLFFGSTMDISFKEGGADRHGSLTIGVNGDNLLRKAALTLQENVFFVSGEEVLKAYGKEGQEIPFDIWRFINIHDLIQKKRGVISDSSGNEYFFTNQSPIKDDRHFFIFRLKENEFQLFKLLDESTKELLNTITLQIACIAFGFIIIAMFVLDRILKKLTKPIVQLSHATDLICHGYLSRVSLPERDKVSKDEIGSLYKSFALMVDSMIEGEKAKGLLSKVVSTKIAHTIMSTGVQIGGERREVTILFTDIRNFTPLSEQLEPEDLLELLNAYLSRMSNFIEVYDGVIDKYVGDEIMALFGAPIDLPNSADQAVLCAIDIMEDLKAWNEERKQKGLRVLEVGTGINTGTVVAGNIGGGQRANYTVIGQVVNIAKRLCSVAKAMEIIICKTTLDRIENKEDILFEEQQPVELKGVSHVVPNYRIFGRSRSSKLPPVR
jgi:class 3 adenylate cyclase